MKQKTTVRLVRNATLRLYYAGKHILVDPMLAGKGTLQSALGVYATPRVHLTMPVDEITEGLDMVLLTHNHIDHYDPTVKGYLPKDILFLTQPQDRERIEQDGFTNVEATDHNQTTRAILRNEARHCNVDMNRLLIPEDGESIEL